MVQRMCYRVTNSLDMYRRLALWLKREAGQDLAEYAMLVFFIALAVVAGASLLGDAVLGLYQRIVNGLSFLAG